MNLVIGFLTTILCLLVQALLIVLGLALHSRHSHRLDEGRFSIFMLLVSCVMTLLMVGNFVQVGLWGALFFWLGEFSSFWEAVYHSAVNFATLGYGDIVMSERHRILGPLEAINGGLMIGVSTAMLIATIQDAVRRNPRRQKKGA